MLTLSKALLRSMKHMPAYSLFFSSFKDFHFSTNRKRFMSVDNWGIKPVCALLILFLIILMSFCLSVNSKALRRGDNTVIGLILSIWGISEGDLFICINLPIIEGLSFFAWIRWCSIISRIVALSKTLWVCRFFREAKSNRDRSSMGMQSIAIALFLGDLVCCKIFIILSIFKEGAGVHDIF